MSDIHNDIPRFSGRTSRRQRVRPTLVRVAAALAPVVTVLTPAVLLVFALPAWGDDWAQFRGPGSGAVASPDAAVQTDFSKGLEIGWKVDLPGRGPSSPIVVRGRVIVTASSGTRQDVLHVLAFAAEDGHLLWERQFWATGRTITHPQSANAAPTPASDGRSIFAFFSSNDLVALDLDGNLLWYRGLTQDFPRLGNDVGMSSSPLVVGDTVIVQSESQGESLVAGINTGDGTTQWQLERERAATWTSPALLSNGKSTAVLVESAKAISAINPATGSVLWNHRQDCETISSACALGGLVFVPGKGMTALRLGESSAEPDPAWTNNQLQCGAASPTVLGNRLYAINRGGVLMTAETESGKILSRTRLQGSFWSSPVAAKNRLFALNFEGVGQLVEISDDGKSGKTVAMIPFGETLQASPAVSGGAVFVRSDAHLWQLLAGSEKPAPAAP